METKEECIKRVLDMISFGYYNCGEFLNEIEAMSRPELTEFLKQLQKLHSKAKMYDQLNK